MRLNEIEASIAQALLHSEIFPELERVYTREDVPGVVYMVIDGETVSIDVVKHNDAPAREPIIGEDVFKLPPSPIPIRRFSAYKHDTLQHAI